MKVCPEHRPPSDYTLDLMAEMRLNATHLFRRFRSLDDPYEWHGIEFDTLNNWEYQHMRDSYFGFFQD